MRVCFFANGNRGKFSFQHSKCSLDPVILAGKTWFLKFLLNSCAADFICSKTFYNKCCANSLLNVKQPKLWDLVCKVIIAAKLAQMTSNSLQVHRNLCTNAWKSQPQNTFRISSHMRISVDIPFERIKTQSNVSDFWSGYTSQKDEYF